MLPIAIALAQFAPMIAGMLAGPKAEAVASHVVGIAQAVTGAASPDAALAALQADPGKALEFQTKVVESHVEMARITADVDKAAIAAAAQNAGDINATMQVEAKSDHWPTYSWRPFIGFCFGLLGAISGGTVFVAYLGVIFGGGKADALSYLPGMLGAIAAIMAAMAAPLGIASYFRGKAQADPNVPTDNRG
jgi:hypothetical protein